MLHAMIARKARMSKIIDGAGKQPREDLVTSSLFGTLCFLSSSARRQALTALICADLRNDVEIKLWPKFKLEGRIVEPDVVIRTTLNGRSELWIVEVKWGAHLHNNQVNREIAAVIQGDCIRGGIPRGQHLLRGYTLLGMEAHHEDAIGSARKSHNELGIHGISWHQATERLDELLRSPGIDHGLTVWAKVAADFLRGTPQGSVLGPWPDLVPLSASNILFVSGSEFSLEDNVRPISSTVHSFKQR